jgi:hypothetical protein
MDGLTIAQLTTVAGIATATTLASELFWHTAAVAAAVKDRFGPAVAVGIGIILGILAGVLLGQGQLDLAQDVVNGVVGGFAAMGIHDTFLSPVTPAGAP